MIRFFKYFLESIFIYTFFLIAKILGLNISRKLFSLIFFKIGPFIKSKKIIEENLFRAFGDIDDNHKINIISKMWKNYGMTFIEYVYLKRFRNNDEHINIKGKEVLNSIIVNNKPVIFISGHFANFELMTMELTKQDIKLATIYRPLNNYFLNPYMEYLRKKYVCKNQIKKGISGIRETVQYLNKGYSIALMVDQRLGEGKKLNFFNHEAYTTTLPAQIALKHKLDIVPIYINRNEKNKFELEIIQPIKTSNMENSEKNKIDISLNINKIIEKMILRDPSQWIWTHNRWK